jgi:hypothetical protein
VKNKNGERQNCFALRRFSLKNFPRAGTISFFLKAVFMMKLEFKLLVQFSVL